MGEGYNYIVTKIFLERGKSMWIIYKIFKNLFKLVFIIAIIFLLNSFHVYSSAIKKIPLSDKVSEIKASSNYVKIENISEHLKNYIVNVEDKRFYSHKGVDLISIAGSLISNIEAGYYKYGGSTITQQLAKNLYFSNDKNLTRKLAEIFLAFKLEREFSKDEILELYLNVIYFGNGYYGIQEASLGYFGISAKDLNEYQSSLLVGIPQAPSVYNLNDKNNKSMLRRYQDVLKILVKNKIIEQNKADEFKKIYLAS